MNGQLRLPVARNECLIAGVLTLGLCVLVLLLVALPDPRRLQSANGQDLIAIGVMPLVYAAALALVAFEPGVEILLALAARGGHSLMRVLILLGVPMASGSLAVALLSGAETGSLIFRNGMLGYVACSAATFLVARRSAITVVCVPILMMFFPGDGWWEWLATRPLTSSGEASNTVTGLALFAAGSIVYTVRLRQTGRWLSL